MKAKCNARWIAGIGTVICYLAITTIAGVEFKVGKSLAGQIDHLTVNQSAQPKVWYPNASVGDFLTVAIR